MHAHVPICGARGPRGVHHSSCPASRHLHPKACASSCNRQELSTTCQLPRGVWPPPVCLISTLTAPHTGQQLTREVAAKRLYLIGSESMPAAPCSRASSTPPTAPSSPPPSPLPHRNREVLRLAATAASLALPGRSSSPCLGPPLLIQSGE